MLGLIIDGVQGFGHDFSAHDFCNELTPQGLFILGKHLKSISGDYEGELRQVCLSCHGMLQDVAPGGEFPYDIALSNPFQTHQLPIEINDSQAKILTLLYFLTTKDFL